MDTLNEEEIKHAKEKGMPYETPEQIEAVKKSYKEEHPQEDQQSDDSLLRAENNNTDDNASEEEKKGTLNISEYTQNESSNALAPVNDDNKNNGIAEYTGPLDFFKGWAENNNCTFKQNEEDTETVSGTFFDKDSNEEKGRVSVSKNDQASSDIAGIEALVEYATKAGYESITLGECSEEYAAKMREVCAEKGITLIIKDRENVQTEHATTGQMEEDLEEKANKEPKKEVEQDVDNPKNDDVSEEESDVAEPTKTPEIIALSDGSGNKNEQIITVGEEKDLEETAESQNAGLGKETEVDGSPKGNGENQEPKQGFPFNLAQFNLKQYLNIAQRNPKKFNEELKGLGDKYAQKADESIFERILLHKYAMTFVNNPDDEELPKIGTALKLYGIDSIKIDPKKPDGEVRFVAKDFNSRTDEEQSEIKMVNYEYKLDLGIELASREVNAQEKAQQRAQRNDQKNGGRP